MNYKESMYNKVVINKQNNTFLLYNTRSCNYVVMDQKESEAFVEALHSEEPDLTMQNMFLEKGFWVKGEENEFKDINKNLTVENTFYLTIMPTLACNFRCPYCFEQHMAQRITPEIESSIMEYLYERIKGYHRLNVQWYGGEPLLEIEIIERLTNKLTRLCRDLNIQYVSSMTTNGFLLSWENYLKMKKCKVRRFTITIDGLKENHDATRIQNNGAGSFDIIINNLKEIQKREHSMLSLFTIRTNYTQSSIANKDAWEKYLNDNFLFDPRFKYLPRYAWNNSKSTLDVKQYIQFEYDGNVRTKIFLEGEHINPDYTMIRNAEKRLISLRNGEDICLAGRPNSIMIAPDGRLLKCQVCVDEPINVVGKLGLSTEMHQVDRETLNAWEKTRDEYSICGPCWVYPFCLGKGCAAKTMKEEGLQDRWCRPFINDVNKQLFLLTYNDERRVTMSQ